MAKSRYRYYLTAKDEKLLPEKVQKELKWLRKLLKNEEDLSHYHLCCRLGDEPSPRLKRKFDADYVL